jgi:hypothetical protein
MILPSDNFFTFSDPEKKLCNSAILEKDVRKQNKREFHA